MLQTMKLDAMKRQGKRSDLTSAQLAQKLGRKTSRQILAEQEGQSQDMIRRYIRLADLVPELLEFVDLEKIKLCPAVELSYDDYGCEYITEKQYRQYLKIFREGKDALENHPKTVNEITHSILRTMMDAVSSDRRQWEFEALSPEEQEAEKNVQKKARKNGRHILPN